MSSWFSEGLLLGRIYFWVGEKILDCLNPLISLWSINEHSFGECTGLTGVLFVLTLGHFPFVFLLVDLRLSPSLDLSRRAASGVPVEQPWMSGAQLWVSAHGSSCPACWGKSSDTPGL